MRAEELGDEEAVCAVDLDAIEAGGYGDAGGVLEHGDDVVDLGDGHGFGGA